MFRISVGFICAVILSALFTSCKQHTDGLFQKLPASKTNIDFANNLEKKELFNILYYLYYYNGGGVAIGDINNDGLPDIYFTANSKGHNKLYLNKGNFEFEDITEKAGVAGTSDWCTGVTMADVNGDGLLDIYVSSVSNRYGLKGHNELFINKGNGNFEESSKAYGLDVSCFTTQTVFFDYDHDGDLDCFILNQSHHPHANIVDTSNRHKYDSLSGDRLYRNDLNTPAKKFTDVSAQAGIFQSNLGYGLGVAVGDMNNDGWDDIYIGNDFHENDYYYINNGNGTFTESGAKHFGHYSRFSMGNDIADYNNDGQLDLITVDMLPKDEKILKTYGSDENRDTYKVKIEFNGYQYQYSRNCLQMNNGNGSSFSEVGLSAGVSATDWSWCPLFADFDNDGNKDLFISSGIVKRPVDLDYVRFVSDLEVKKGMNKTDKYDNTAISSMPDGSSHPFLFRGDGKLSFTDLSNEWGTGDLKGYYNGAAYADLDNDGKLDLVVSCLNANALILKNNAHKSNYISLSFKGEGMNRTGIGCKAYLFQKGKMQYQQLMLTRGFQSSSDTKLHFGLGADPVIDSMLLVWPNQKYQVIKSPATNKTDTVSQANASGVFNYVSFFPPAKEYFEDISDKINLNWKHKENDFLDYNIQYLIPHLESTRGPKTAVADVNNDGMDDLFVCGSKDQAGTLFIQNKQGKFIATDTAIFNTLKGTEQVDALFFDANKDGFMDLYVVSGGNEYKDGSPALRDHLFINDGKGNFKDAPAAIPEILKNKSCVLAADADNDGDLDLFVGGLADATEFGIAQPSYLLVNDGKGNFTQASESVIPLKDIGIVTSAAFADINKDGWTDLIVTGEWMPLKIFINNKGRFTETDIPQSTGLWQSLYATDMNGDGYADILAGNWGHNSKFYEGKTGPLKLYIKDFDHNGSIEQVLAYTVNGQEYPFLAKDELERALPVLKKAYLKYDEVAGKTVQYMFYDLFKDYKELKAETLSSSYFINNGKGGFTRKDLPDQLQLAPVFSFLHTGNNQFLLGGNFFDVIPYEGRYDAQPVAMFAINKDSVTHIPQINLPGIKGQVRDIKHIRTAAYGDVILIARNNMAPLFLKEKN